MVRAAEGQASGRARARGGGYGQGSMGTAMAPARGGGRAQAVAGRGQGAGRGTLLWLGFSSPPQGNTQQSRIERGGGTPLPPFHGPQPMPSHCPLTPSASLNGICNRQ